MHKAFTLLDLRWKPVVLLFFFLIVMVPGLGIAQDRPAEFGPVPEVFPSALPANSQHPPEAHESDHKATADSSLRLGAGDLLEFSVYNVPELSTKTRVGNSGNVYLPLIDYVHVAGLTVEEAQAVIEKRLSDGGFLNTPHVMLFVDEYTSAGASVLGEVAKPGIYPVLGEQRLFDLISAAGGFTEKAGHSVTITHRNQSDRPVIVTLARNLADKPESNIQILPGDTIAVRKADVVYVVGDVAKPTGLLLDSGSVTVLQAIALAGGTNRTAKLNGAKIIRKGAKGMSETPIRLQNILNAKAQDISLQADDILVVPASRGKVLAGRTLEAAMQTATFMSVAAVHP
jgi:polysaccharide export outer membrane protein